MGRFTGLCECGCGAKTELALYTRRDPRCRSVYRSIRGQPHRFVPGHHYRVFRQQAELQRKAEYEDRGYITPCLIWLQKKGSTAKCRKRPYIYDHRTKRCRTAYRVLWERHTGEVLPRDVDLHHQCKQPDCVRLDHLLPVKHNKHLFAGLTIVDMEEFFAQRESGMLILEIVNCFNLR